MELSLEELKTFADWIKLAGFDGIESGTEVCYRTPRPKFDCARLLRRCRWVQHIHAYWMGSEAYAKAYISRDWWSQTNLLVESVSCLPVPYLYIPSIRAAVMAMRHRFWRRNFWMWAICRFILSTGLTDIHVALVGKCLDVQQISGSSWTIRSWAIPRSLHVPEISSVCLYTKQPKGWSDRPCMYAAELHQVIAQCWCRTWSGFTRLCFDHVSGVVQKSLAFCEAPCDRVWSNADWCPRFRQSRCLERGVFDICNRTNIWTTSISWLNPRGALCTRKSFGGKSCRSEVSRLFQGRSWQLLDTKIRCVVFNHPSI